MIHEPDCPLIPKLIGRDGFCDLCGEPLPKRRRRWCSHKCASAYTDAIYGQHDWNLARHKAYIRDGRVCVKCGSNNKLEVNHIEPRNGQGYGRGCHHHLENLETLCHDCHVKVTNGQRIARKANPQQVEMGIA